VAYIVLEEFLVIILSLSPIKSLNLTKSGKAVEGF
jgi:hypothetical protein